VSDRRLADESVRLARELAPELLIGDDHPVVSSPDLASIGCRDIPPFQVVRSITGQADHQVVAIEECEERTANAQLLVRDLDIVVGIFPELLGEEREGVLSLGHTVMLQPLSATR
jgi:hypothetical protein